MLYICGTPIGNLEDITLRQLRILKEADLIAAEDTRRSLKLLNYYDITKPLVSYHHHNRKSKGDYLLDKLREGLIIALITDGGMPLISDPGAELVSLCRQNNIPVTTVPGPTAFVSAFILSGFNTEAFSFFGFKSHKELKLLANEEKTMILYEAPHRLTKTLKVLKEILGNRKIAIVREITKIYEESLFFTLEEGIEYYKSRVPKGEFVIVIEGQKRILEWDISVTEHVNMYLQKGFSEKEAIKLTAKDRNLPKREVYGIFNCC